MREAISNYCARIGKDPLLVQGLGGNVSWKEGKTLWIKASGRCLAEAEKDDIFVPVVLDELRIALAETPVPQLPGRTGGNAHRPSIETFMHVAMPQKIVVHLHAIEALAVLVRSDAHETLRICLGSRFSWTWVPYRQPGAALAQAVAHALYRTPDANVVFLQNHGILVGGETIEHIDGCLADISSDLKQDLSISDDFEPHPDAPFLPSALHVGPMDYVAIEDERVQSMVHIWALYQRLSEAWALYPDHIVFLGEKAPVFENRADAEKYGRRYRPTLLFIKDDGVFVKPGFDNTQLAQLKCYYDIISRQREHHILVELDQKDRDDLTHWEAERYRVEASRQKGSKI